MVGAGLPRLRTKRAVIPAFIAGTYCASTVLPGLVAQWVPGSHVDDVLRTEPRDDTGDGGDSWVVKWTLRWPPDRHTPETARPVEDDETTGF